MRSYYDLDEDQLDGIDAIYENPDVFVMADVGKGKTVMTLTALQFLIEDGIANKAIVFAPLRVASEVWVQEVDEWDHLSLKGVSLVSLPPPARMDILVHGVYDFVVVNYELFLWLSKTFPNGKGLEAYDALICDEVDKLKDTRTATFKGKPPVRDPDTGRTVSKAVHGMKRYRDNFERHIVMTGTPTSKGLADLWSQMYVCDGGKRLGTGVTAFKRRFFYEADDFGRQLIPFPHTERDIYRLLEGAVFRAANDGADMPKLRDLPPRMVDMTDKQQALYAELNRECIAFLKDGAHGVSMLDGDPVELMQNGEADHIVMVDSPAVLWGKLRQLACGFLYVNKGTDEEPVLEPSWLNDAKFKELDNLISELQGQQLMIVHAYTAQSDELKRRYGDRIGVLDGGTGAKESRRIIEAWNSGELELLSMHPFSAGHGLNLQKSGAHHVCMLTEPRTGGLYRQVIGRLLRRGSDAEYVFVHHIHTRFTNDHDDLEVCYGRIQTDVDLLKAMEERQAWLKSAA